MSGIIREFKDNVDNLAMIATQDVEAILDMNKEDFNDPNRGWTPSRNMRHIAEIPNIVVEIWLNKYGIDALNPDHAEGVRRLLNSNEWRYLRTAPGRV